MSVGSRLFATAYGPDDGVTDRGVRSGQAACPGSGCQSIPPFSGFPQFPFRRADDGRAEQGVLHGVGHAQVERSAVKMTNSGWRAAVPGGAGMWFSWSGGGLEGDFVAEGFELADVATLAAFGSMRVE